MLAGMARGYSRLAFNLNAPAGPCGYWVRTTDAIVGSVPIDKIAISKIVQRGWIRNGSHSNSNSVVFSYRYHIVLGIVMIRKPRGFWKDPKNLHSEVRNIIRTYGRIPSTPELQELGHGGLARAIEKYSSITDVRQAHGFAEDNRHFLDKYEDWNLFAADFKQVVADIGTFPTGKQLRALDRSDLEKAAYKYHGSLVHVRERLGFQPKTRPNKYWNEYSNVIKEAKLLVEQYGDLPSSSTLQKTGYGSLVQAVCNMHGGFHKLRNDLGLKAHGTPSGTWSRSVIKEQFLTILCEHGCLPTGEELKEKGHSPLLAAIENYFGGLRNLAIECGVHERDLPVQNGYWQIWGNLECELKKIIEQLEGFPTDQDLLILSAGSVRSAVRHFGGLRAVRKRMGFECPALIAEDGHHCDSYSEKLIDNFLNNSSIMHRRNVRLCLDGLNCVPDFLIPPRGLVEVLMVDYRHTPASAIRKSYVEKYKIKRKAYLAHDYRLIEVFPSDFCSPKAFETKCEELFSEFGSGGAIAVPPIYFAVGRRHPGYWRQTENIKAELKPICEELGRFPTYKELELRGRSDLIHAMNRYHGGQRKLARKIGCPVENSLSHQPRGFWKDNLEFVLGELRRIEREQGKFPTSCFLRDNAPSLYYAITRYYGGMKEVRREFEGQ